MAGYHGFSMSNNAVEAYQHGEKPRSKWTKTAIIEELIEQEAPQEVIDAARRTPLNVLRDVALMYSAYHHTSSYYNTTDFFSVDAESVTVDLLIEKTEQYAHDKSEKPATDEPVMRKVHYLTWSGSRKHPKATDHEEVCEIRGQWAYTSNGKKLITGNGFRFMD